MPSLDIVIATYNRHARLNRCLAALTRQSVGSFRVIVVDDSSDPPVGETIRRRYSELLDLQVVRTPGNSGPAAGRNLGVRHGEGELILFVDDDVDADPVLVERHLAAMERSGEHAVVIGPLLAPRDWRPTPWNRWEARKLAAEYEKMATGIYEPTWRQLFTGNTMVRRRDFEAAGGFDESFTRAEDIEFGVRLHLLGCRFVFEPRAKGWHYAHRSLASWRKIPREYGRFDARLDRMYPQLAWMELVGSELEERHWLVRAARWLPAKLTEPAALAGAVLCDRVHCYGAASAGLSFVYDSEYRASLHAALQAAPGQDPSACAALAALSPQKPGGAK